MGDTNPTKNYEKDADDQSLQTVAYMFAGLAMMLNIRLSYSAAPYALLRFKLPENLFSVFVRTTSSALELWCIPSMLIGNLMEQFFINTQDKSTYHYLGFKAEADNIQKKVTELKSTAGTQSASELGHTNQTDLQQTSNIPETKLEEKANQLKSAASELNRVAGLLETAANQGPLQPLKDTAGNLKTAAMGSDNGLYEKAELLAKKRTDASGEADQVIGAFEKVETEYAKLMTEYKKILNDKEQAAKLTEGDKGKVIEVVKAYFAVKNTYYQMLVSYRIKKKATAEIGEGTDDDKILQKAKDLHAQAKALAEADGLNPDPEQDPDAQLKEQLKKLAEALSDAVGEDTEHGLQKALNELKNAEDDNIVVNALEVIIKYNAVKAAYEKVKEKESEYTRLGANNEYDPVKSAFEELEKKFKVLQKSIENVLRLRVQELSTLAQTLSSKANELVSDNELKNQATALKDAASNSSGLKEKADALVQTINGTGTVTNQATQVITQFDHVTEKYQALIAKANENNKQSEPNVQAVDDAYTALKTLYDQILNFPKISHYSTQLHTAATPNNVNAEKVIINFNSVAAAYNLLDPYIQLIVQSQFTELKTVYSNAIYFYKKCVLAWPSIITNWLNFLTFVILLIIYVTGGDQGHVTGYYWIMAISGFVFGINMVLVYAVDYRYLAFYMAGENSFPMVTSLILYFATSIFGNRRKYNSDYLVVLIDISIAILIALVASVLWTCAFYFYRTPIDPTGNPDWTVISPIAMVIVGMGLVYSIYPGIAPGMIVPFYLIDKIEMVLLIATAFPPIIIAFLRKYAKDWSPQTDFLLHSHLYKFGGWKQYNANEFGSSWPPTPGATVYAWIWHFFDILIPLQISLAVIFIYSLHYRDSSIARSIINQPKMSTFLTIVFYMCHEILLALGFPGMVGNNGAGGAVLLPVQYVGALLMVFLAFYSIGYITEYKKHDPSQWPTEGMTKWNAMCYWLKMASKITNKNFKQLFTTDLRRELYLFILYKLI